MAPQVHRLFFALKPDPVSIAAIARAVAEIQATRRVNGRWLRGDKHHFTLLFLGDHAAPEALIAGAGAAAARVRQAPFSFTLDHARSFGQHREAPCVLRCAVDSERDLQALHDDLAAALREAGLGEYLERRPYLPHLTIARGSPLLQPIAITPIAWHVHDFVLIDSLVGQSVYTEVARWELTGA